ncbi:flagellin [Mameliella sediminis]|uniref:flagellin n=1 Tax=Mameliella sediminis TaxID=2836866 RepID=UPI001C460687|nr:flagellin [Mameliella sediminis]MBY6115785.1 flagellin [Antarctobacter heliothermus]MBY6145437.1 flagellin [Mameliella alba]MBV7393839.1 flagellin [Mameliella sediminis]MBY6162248.1 flagellin [Mameliella alba]MBY6170717.1 flagellin [Mameliella alba]
MSSINSNPGATAALQTLKAINASMSNTQAQIATGKKVSSSQDNAAVWAIAKTMEADVEGFKRVSDSLSLGEATVSVARQGAETVTDLLTEIKGKVVAAQEENVDRAKIQTDIEALRNQISSIVSAAQFNGQGLLTNTDQTAGSGGINVLSSIDRSMDSVESSDIRIAKQDLGQGAASIGSGLTALAAGANDITGTGDAVAATLTGAATAPTGTTTFGSGASATVAAGTGFSVEISSTAGGAPSNTSGRNDISYVARDGDTMADVAAGLAAAFNKYVSDDLGAGNEGTIDASASGNQITFTGADQGGDNFSITVQQYAADSSSTIGGGLAELANIDVTTQEGVDSALTEMEGLLQTAIDAAAAFGSAEMRLDTQKEFVSGLTDALKSGIGTLVDADLEEVSAKLQAQQVQQQLAMQALSIANQSPRSLLSLFR